MASWWYEDDLEEYCTYFLGIKKKNGSDLAQL